MYMYVCMYMYMSTCTYTLFSLSLFHSVFICVYIHICSIHVYVPNSLFYLASWLFLNHHTLLMLSVWICSTNASFARTVDCDRQYRACPFRHLEDLEVVHHTQLLDIVLVTNRA